MSLTGSCRSQGVVAHRDLSLTGSCRLQGLAALRELSSSTSSTLTALKDLSSKFAVHKKLLLLAHKKCSTSYNESPFAQQTECKPKSCLTQRVNFLSGLIYQSIHTDLNEAEYPMPYVAVELRACCCCSCRASASNNASSSEVP